MAERTTGGSRKPAGTSPSSKKAEKGAARKEAIKNAATGKGSKVPPKNSGAR